MPPGLGDPSPPPPCLHLWGFGVPKWDPAHPVPGVSLWGWARASPAGFGGLQTGDPRGVAVPGGGAPGWSCPLPSLGMGLEEAEGPRSTELAPKAISERGINQHLQLVLAGVNEVFNINSAPQVLPPLPPDPPHDGQPQSSQCLARMPRGPAVSPNLPPLAAGSFPAAPRFCLPLSPREGTDGDPGDGVGTQPHKPPTSEGWR